MQPLRTYAWVLCVAVFGVFFWSSTAYTQSAPAKQVQDEYNRRAKQIYKEIAKERLSVARSLAHDGMHAWARLEHAKILSTDPDNEAAEAALKRLRTVSKKLSDEDLANQRRRYLYDLDRIGQLAAKKHLALAAWCDRKQLDEWVMAHRLEAHACDPTNKDVAAALGFETSSILRVPSSPETMKIFERFRKRSETVSMGSQRDAKTAGWGAPEIRSKVQVAYGKYVGVQSSWMGHAKNEKTKGWLEALCRWGDHSYIIAHELLGEKPPETERRYWFAWLSDYEYKFHTEHVLKDKSRYRHLVTPKCRAWRGDMNARRVSRKHRKKVPLHTMAHLVPQFVITRRLWKAPLHAESLNPSAYDRGAIIEGFGILCELVGRDSGKVWCSGLPSTTTGGERNNYRQYVSTIASRLEDSSTLALFRADFSSLSTQGTGAAKAASIQEWLFARDRSAAVAFLRDLVTKDADVAKIIRKHFGWCPEEFDEHWRRWAIAIHLADELAQLQKDDPDVVGLCPACKRGIMRHHYEFKSSGKLVRCPKCRARLPEELRTLPDSPR